MSASPFAHWLAQALTMATLLNATLFLFVDGAGAPESGAAPASAEQVARTLLHNAGLVLLFVVPHSALAFANVTSLVGLSKAAHRLLFVLLSACSLTALTHYWAPASLDWVLLDVRAVAPLRWLLHAAFGGAVCALALRLAWVGDVGDANNEATHTHPLFVAPVVMLVAAPVVTLSRLLLAASLALYLLFGNSVQAVDVMQNELAMTLLRRQLETPHSRRKQR
jgi:hypothetical protein